MPILVTEQGAVHYETYGRGRPVIFLHGWLGSWSLWRSTIEEMGKHYRTYALDFFGFGDSSDRATDFSVSNFAEVVNQFMDRLGIPKAPLVGHSMGGTVSLSVAMRYPEKVVKVVVIGSPIQGSSLNLVLKLSGYKGIAEIAFAVPYLLDFFVWSLIRFGGRSGRKVYAMVKQDVTKVSVDSFFQSIGTLRQTNLTNDLAQLQMPILGIYGKRDIIVDPRQSKVLSKFAPTSQQAWFEKSGHFPMMDEPERFYTTIHGFLSGASTS